MADLVEPEFDELRIDAAAALVDGEMRRPDRGGGVEIFLDGEERVKSLVLRDDSDVGLQIFVLGVEVDAVEIDATTARLELSAEGFEESTLAASARAHDADHLASLDRKSDAVESGDLAIVGVAHVARLERADDVALLFDNAFGKVAAQVLITPEGDDAAVFERGLTAHELALDGDGAL